MYSCMILNLLIKTMNENIDLTKILKDCPEGIVFWSDNYGEVKFLRIDTSLENPIKMERADGYSVSYTKEGWCRIEFPASCLLWPSRDCRDWSKFTAPWYKKDKFDPKTLKAFDRVLVRHECYLRWRCEFFSYIHDDNGGYPYVAISGAYKRCIPYNEETKHLIGTTDEAPEYYRYWED